MELPLEGIRILELATFVAAPCATMLLSDMGAEVVKVESSIGDDARRLDTNAYLKNESKFHLAANRNKRSVVIDTTRPEGQRLVHELAAQSDVFLENFRPGLADTSGFGYEELAKLNPRLIYASVSAFGKTGPYGQKPGFDLIVQGYTGTMSRSHVDGHPSPLTLMVADSSTPMLVAYGIMLALFVRERTGRGQRVETSLLSGALTMQAMYFVKAVSDPTPPRPFKLRPREMATYRAYETKDGYVNVAVLSDRLFERMARAIGLARLIDDPRFENHPRRMENNRYLGPQLEEAFKQKTRDEWVQILEAVGVPCGPVNALAELFEDPHVVENELVAEMEHPTLGRVKTLGVPVKLSETPGRIRRPAPLLGQHTDEVMAELGYTPTEIADLRARAIVA